MRISPQKKHNRTPYIITLLVILLIGAGALYFFVIRKPATPANSTTTTIANTESTNTTPQTPVDDKSTTPTPPLDDNAPTSALLGISISSFSQKDNSISVAAATTGASTGTCIFTFSADNSKPVSQTVPATNSSCSTTLSALQFDRVGAWKLTVTFYQTNTEKVEVSQNVTIN